MGRLFVAASSQRMEAASAALAVKPVSLSCWCKPTSITGTQYLFGLLSSSTANRAFILGHITGTPFVLERGSAGAQGNAASALSNGVWGHVGGTMAATGTGSRIAYLNGVAGTAVTTNVATPPTLDRVEVGAANPSVAGTFANFTDAILAECAIWNVTLSAGEMAALARGVSARLIRPGALVFYAPLWGTGSPEPDYTAGQRTLTLTGTPAVAAHPPVASAIPLGGVA